MLLPVFGFELGALFLGLNAFGALLVGIFVLSLGYYTESWRSLINVIGAVFVFGLGLPGLVLWFLAWSFVLITVAMWRIGEWVVEKF